MNNNPPDQPPTVRANLSPEFSRRTLLIQGGRGAVALGALGAFGSLLAACVDTDPKSTSSNNDIKPGGILMAGVASDPDSLDPQLSSLAVSATIYAAVFSRLLELENDGSYTPSLAESWTNPDDKTYVFKLRDGVQFHNGEPLTADDVAYTFTRMLDEKLGATYAADFLAVEAVEATAPNEVTFRLSQPFAPLLANLANRGHILNRKALEANDPNLVPIGTGPFAFDAWSQGQEVRLVKNDDFFLPERPFLDGVTFKYRPNDQGRVTALKAQELHWVDGVPPQSVEGIERDSSLNYISSSTTGKPEFMLINQSSPRLANKALRQAICWAVDRSEIAKVGFFDAVEPGACEVGQSSTWYTDNDPYASAPNPDKVRELLTEAGIGEEGVTINFLAWTSGPDAERTAQIVKQQLAPFNINVEIETMEISVWVKRLFSKDYDLTLAFQEQIVDPDNFWSLFFTSTASQNVTGYANPVVDDLVARATAETDETKRRDLYGQIRAAVLDDAQLLFTVYMPLNYATRSDVLGASISPAQDPRFVDVGMT